VLIAGSNANNAGNAGVFYLNANNSLGNRNQNISARLAEALRSKSGTNPCFAVLVLHGEYV
jgi:hypothetical protein